MTDESAQQSTTRPYSAIFDVQHSNERENGDADEQHIQNYRSLEEELNSLDIENKLLNAKNENLEEENRLLSSILAQTQRYEGENHQKLMRSQESYEEMSRNLDSSRREIGELKRLESLKAKKRRMADEQHIQNCKSLKEKSNSLDIENKSLRAKIEKLEEDNRLLSSNLAQTQRYEEENYQKLMYLQESHRSLYSEHIEKLDKDKEMSRNLDSSRREIGELRKHNKSLKAKNKRMAENYSSLLKGKETEVENAKQCMARYEDSIAEKQNELMEKEAYIRLLEENANEIENYYSSQLKSYQIKLEHANEMIASRGGKFVEAVKKVTSLFNVFTVCFMISTIIWLRAT